MATVKIGSTTYGSLYSAVTAADTDNTINISGSSYTILAADATLNVSSKNLTIEFEQSIKFAVNGKPTTISGSGKTDPLKIILGTQLSVVKSSASQLTFKGVNVTVESQVDNGAYGFAAVGVEKENGPFFKLENAQFKLLVRFISSRK